MGTQVTIGYGTLFEMADPATPTVYDYVPEIFNVTPPPINIEQSDATSNQSPNRSREFIPGLNEQQQTSFSMNYIPGSAADLLMISAAGIQKNCRYTFPNGRSCIFVGNLSSYEPDAPTEGRMEAAVQFTLSGGFIMTPTAAPRNVVLPVIDGVAVVGGILTLNTGVWAGALSLEVQWQRSTDDGVGDAWANITGAIGLAYVPTDDDIDERIRALVKGVNSAFDTEVETVMTAAVPDPDA